MKRASMAAREENYEHVLMCLICRSLFDDYDHQPKFLPCHHTFCKDCLREYVKQMGDEIECPSCRKIANIPTAGVTALQTNFYVKYIHSLVSGSGTTTSTVKQCEAHPSEKLQYLCRDCDSSICKQCCNPQQCGQHDKIALTQATEETHQQLDKAFSKANGTIEGKKVKLETTLKALADEKDQALLKIDSTFDQHNHQIQRRATLLKNKVIAIYNEHKDKLEHDLEEISTALTCIVSIKDYHEEKLSQGDFKDIPKGIEELEEVDNNIDNCIHPAENHIVFEQNHGVDRFKGSLRDLGRVRCSRPIAPRSEPEGNAGEENSDVGTTPDITPCIESRPFRLSSQSSPDASQDLASPQNSIASNGASASFQSCSRPPDVTQCTNLDSVFKSPEEEKRPVRTNPGPRIITEDQKQTASSDIKPVKPQHKQMDIAKQPPVKPDVKPKVKPSVIKQGESNCDVVDANQNCSSSAKLPNKSADKPYKTGTKQILEKYRLSSDLKSDRQNGNIVGLVTSRIPTKPGGLPSPTDKPSQIPGLKSGGKSSKLERIKPTGISSSKSRLAQPVITNKPQLQAACAPATSHCNPAPSNHSLVNQVIASMNQSNPNTNNSKTGTGAGCDHSGGAGAGPTPAVRPDSLLKTAVTGAAAAAMPDLLPESVLKVMQSGTDDEKLRAEKEYYHLLYTSYDEEELLRELKSGAAPSVDPAPGVAPGNPNWNIRTHPSLEDSDNSWLTTSSASDGATDECDQSDSSGETTDENDVIAAPQQTTV